MFKCGTQVPDLMVKLFLQKATSATVQFDFVNLFPEPSTRIGELFTFKHLYFQTIASVWR